MKTPAHPLPASSFPRFPQLLRAPAALALGLILTASAQAQDKSWLKDWREKQANKVPQQYLCHYTAVPLKIDGKQDDAAWATAPWTEYFQDIEGDAKPRPTFKTHARMLWDEQYLYIAASLEEPHIWATVTKRDEVIFVDPDFEVFIDPDGDNHQYYEFEMNALNTGWDLFMPKPYKDGGGARNDWNIEGLKTAVNLRGTINNAADRDEGWDVEIAIPWKALGEYTKRPSPPLEGDQWRAGFSRVEWLFDIIDGKYVKKPKVPEHNWIWSPQGVIDMHRPETWAFVQFTRLAPGAVSFVPDPSITVRYALQEVYYAQMDYHQKTGSWSLDFKELGVTPPAGDAWKDWKLEKTAAGYQCSVQWQSPKGFQTWAIQQDSLVGPVK
jgi:hypothetical protein